MITIESSVGPDKFPVVTVDDPTAMIKIFTYDRQALFVAVSDILDMLDLPRDRAQRAAAAERAFQEAGGRLRRDRQGGETDDQLR